MSVAEGWVVHHSLTPDLVPVLVVPDFEILTSDSRKVVPDCVPLDVAVRTLGRLTALIEGLRTGSGEILDNARGDEIHEMPRLTSYPETARLMEVAVEAGAVYACLSGAGPSILSLARRDQVPTVQAALADALRGEGKAMVLAPDTTGAS